MDRRQLLYCIIIGLLIASILIITVSGEDESLYRVNSDEDESSCICGLNRGMLDKLEGIIRLGLSGKGPDHSGKDSSGEEATTTDPKNDESSQPEMKNGLDSLTEAILRMTSQIEKLQQIVMDFASQSSNTKPTVNTSEAKPEISQSHDEDRDDPIPSANVPSLKPVEQQQPPKMPIRLPTASATTTSPSITTLSPPIINRPNQHPSKDPKEDDESEIVDSGFLGGIPTPASSHNEALMKLNQSDQIAPEDMASAIQSTVPNLISNIFSSIQNLTIEAEHNHNPATNEPGKLTSIDGSSVTLGSNSSVGEIQAEGEALFAKWIDHQLQSLHLTASTAAYIQKNAVNLFRKIVAQYIAQIVKLGGSLQDNVRRATQAALSNTQYLTSFLMKNYLNFAGGMMQIIGDYVSRVGKQIDSTGVSISKVTLNPFEIVSNVIDSLPNPSDYSKYFRAFGKNLLGELVAFGTPGSDNTENKTASKPQPSSSFISKTIGAIGKTLGNWFHNNN